MQRRYLARSGYVVVPGSNGKYSISLEGIIRDEKGRNLPIIRNSDGDHIAFMDLWDGLREYPAALVMAFTFKPHELPECHWNALSVGFVDGDKSNLHPGNLVWLYPEGGLECPDKPGFNYIPGFTRYVVSAEGEFFCTKNKTFKTAHETEKGYFRFEDLSADATDHRNSRMRRHRAVALAWLQYTVDVDALHVNHIDGVKGNDGLENLEWVTASGNVQHAKSMELIAPSKPVLVRNTITGEVTRYLCVKDCGVAFRVPYTFIRNRLDKDPKEVWFRCFQFKFESNLSEW
ncbi:hypothetical protein D3C85_159070 [compost metagenome]